MLVPVDAAAGIFLRIVQVDDAKPFEPQDVVEGLHGLPVVLPRFDRVPGGEDVARVQTYVHAFLVLDPIQDVGQMLEPVANGGSLPGGRLETDLRLAARGSVEDSVEGLDDPGQALRLAGAYMRSGMCDEERNAQEVTPPCLLEQSDPGLPEEGLVRGGEIDEIAVMCANDPHIRFFLCQPELLDFSGEDFSAPPLVSGPGEDLHDFAGASLAVVGGIVQSACYGNVGTEHRMISP